MRFYSGSVRDLKAMDNHAPSKKILITSNSPILLRILKLNLGSLRLHTGACIELVEYSPGSEFGKDEWKNDTSFDLIVAALSSTVDDFRPFFSQLLMISEASKIPLLAICDYWPSELAPNKFSMSLKIPFELGDLYARVESVLLEEQTRNIP
jgi:hypothetical protein